MAAALATALAPGHVGAQPERSRFALAAGPLRLVPSTGRPIRVGGLHAYFGTVVLDARPDGLVVVNRLPLEDYLLGLNEVPVTWPAEALKAQAVAARTYAARTLAVPRAGAAAAYGFDICASVQCQVFSGADVVLGSGGDAWRSAVESTAGQLLTYEGGAILARYHSTSGRVTLDNEDVFVGEPSYPYLVGVPSPFERASPLFRWRVAFPLRRLERMLLRGAAWSRSYGRLRAAVTVASAAGLHYPDVVLRGDRGATSMTAEELRDIVRDVAPSLYPDAYPSAALTASGRLPETLPSNRYEMRTKKRVAYIVGRGWGHGVGMSQWGAFGMAQRGADYRSILGHYYRGVRLVDTSSAGNVDVGVAWQLKSVAADGDLRIVDGDGRTLAEDALGRWNFEPSGSDVRIRPPRGHELPLTIELIGRPERLSSREVALEFLLSKPARVRVITAPARGRDQKRVFDAGRGEVRVRFGSGPGRYRVWLVAEAGDATERVAAGTVVVGSSPVPLDPGVDVSVVPWWLWPLAALAGVAAVAAVTIASWRRRRR